MSQLCTPSPSSNVATRRPSLHIIEPPVQNVILDLHASKSILLVLSSSLLTNKSLSTLIMPLWRIFSNPATFTPAQKAALVSTVSSLYTDGGLPAFYVVVLFINVEPDSFFVSGKPQDKFVRIAIEHIAYHQPKMEDDVENRRGRMINKINKVRASTAPSREDELVHMVDH